MYKKITILPFVIAMSLYTNNAKADTLMELHKCAQTKDSLVRLVCYDQVMKSLNSLPVDKSASSEIKALKADTVVKAEKQTAYRPSVAKPIVKQQSDKEKSFGQEHLKKKQKPSVEGDDIVLIVKSVKKSVQDKRVITFENGQVWKQSDTEYINLEPSNKVKLSKGLFGVIYLQKMGQNRKIKVKRQK